MRHVLEVILEERMRAAPCVIDNLIGDHDSPAIEPGSDSPDRCDRDDSTNPRLVQGPDIGAVIHPMGRNCVRDAVTGEKRNRDTFQQTMAQRCGWPTPRRVDGVAAYDSQTCEFDQARSSDDGQTVHEVSSA